MEAKWGQIAVTISNCSQIQCEMGPSHPHAGGEVAAVFGVGVTSHGFGQESRASFFFWTA